MALYVFMLTLSRIVVNCVRMHKSLSPNHCLPSDFSMQDFALIKLYIKSFALIKLYIKSDIIQEKKSAIFKKFPI